MSPRCAADGAPRLAHAAPSCRRLRQLGSGRAALVGCALALLGCPEHVDPPGGGGGPVECAAVGQRCQVGPGKLGTCVAIDGCRGDRCFVCQSQH